MKCENCGKEQDGSYGCGRFCCERCAKSFAGKHFYRDRLKTLICPECGESFTVYANVSSKSNVVCSSCRDKIDHRSKCSICGREYDSRIGCQNDFCKTINSQGFKTLIKYFGFDKEKLGTPDVEIEYNRVRDILYDLYWNQHKSSKEIAEIFNYPCPSSNIVQKYFKTYLNIPVKSVRYATVENYIEDRVPAGNGCHHKTWNGKDVYLRSSYELDYANSLDKMCIDYDVECLRINYFDTQECTDRIAIPDFYLPETNTIVEIKSDWTLNIQNMIDKRKAYLENGYNFKLVLEHKEVDLDKLDA